MCGKLNYVNFIMLYCIWGVHAHRRAEDKFRSSFSPLAMWLLGSSLYLQACCSNQDSVAPVPSFNRVIPDDLIGCQAWRQAPPPAEPFHHPNF